MTDAGNDHCSGGTERVSLDSNEVCRCGRPAIPNTNWCSSRCYQNAVEDAEVGELPCINDHWWCPGPEGASVDHEPFGGKCMDCSLQTGTDQPISQSENSTRSGGGDDT